jgi:hypothetical protein
MKIIRVIFLLSSLFVLSISNLSAAPAAVVEGLQMPAWLERGPLKLPLTTGMGLQSGDRIITGQNAKLLLRLEEGSHIKLGENARINLDKLAPPKQPSGLFSGLMKIVKGAFRFTTSKVGQSRRRAVDIQIGTFTAGIRGTDIWGRSNTEKDLVCLIEGKISVDSDGGQFTMSDPLTFYVKPRNAPADPVGLVDENQLKQWALETELQAGDGIISEQGSYFINLMSLSSKQLAEENLNRFHQAGYAADIQQATVGGKSWYRLRINRLSTSSDAEKLSAQLSEQFGLTNTWIGRS